MAEGNNGVDTQKILGNKNPEGNNNVENILTPEEKKKLKILLERNLDEITKNKIIDSLKKFLPDPINKSDINQVWIVQLILKFKGEKINVDGTWGEDTEKAYNKFFGNNIDKKVKGTNDVENTNSNKQKIKDLKDYFNNRIGNSDYKPDLDKIINEINLIKDDKILSEVIKILEKIRIGIEKYNPSNDKIINFLNKAFKKNTIEPIPTNGADALKATIPGINDQTIGDITSTTSEGYIIINYSKLNKKIDLNPLLGYFLVLAQEKGIQFNNNSGGTYKVSPENYKKLDNQYKFNIIQGKLNESILNGFIESGKIQKIDN